jgi:hypothetical protein
MHAEERRIPGEAIAVGQKTGCGPPITPDTGQHYNSPYQKNHGGLPGPQLYFDHPLPLHSEWTHSFAAGRDSSMATPPSATCSGNL